MRLVPVFLLAFALVLPLAGQAQKSGNVTDVARTDPTMNAAIAEARRSLPLFLDRLGPGPEFRVKISVPLPGGDDEVIWANEIRALGGNRYSARLTNQPVRFAGSLGDRIEFRGDQIADWGWQSPDGRLYGNYTTRVLLPMADPQTRANLAAVLSPDPVPATWR